jgi:hypothetical protein
MIVSMLHRKLDRTIQNLFYRNLFSSQFLGITLAVVRTKLDKPVETQSHDLTAHTAAWFDPHGASDQISLLSDAAVKRDASWHIRHT